MISDGRPDPISGPTARGRRFGVYDSMILIGGIALLLAFGGSDTLSLIQQASGLVHAISAYHGSVPSNPGHPLLLNSVATHWSSVLWYVVQELKLSVLVLTAIFLPMRLGRPRPPLRALLRQPGTVAGLGVLLGLWATGWMHYAFFGRLVDRTVPLIAIGGAVALCWAGLALSRRWEAEPCWIDRIGRALGTLAIASGVVAYSLYGL